MGEVGGRLGNTLLGVRNHPLAMGCCPHVEDSFLNLRSLEVDPRITDPYRRTYELDPSTLTSRTNLSYGLPTAEALRVCRSRYRHDFAKLKLQVVSPPGDADQVRR